jgi:hypothetical protein
MMDLEKLKATLEKNGFGVKIFETAKDAADELDRELDGKSIGIGGSVTIDQLGVYERLKTHNDVKWHQKAADPNAERIAACHTQVYLTSVNGLAETGELINIDGTGNRVAQTLYGHERVIFVAGINKIAPDFASALDRARNVASPLNARRLKRQTPCALSEPMRCHDCSSPDRICNGLVVHYKKMGGIGKMDVYLVREPLGY